MARKCQYTVKTIKGCIVKLLNATQDGYSACGTQGYHMQKHVHPFRFQWSPYVRLPLRPRSQLEAPLCFP